MQLSVCVACVLFAVVEGFAPAQAAGTGSDNGNGHVGKKGHVYTDYEKDASQGSQLRCDMESNYEISQDYIIRTTDSKANGAKFVSALKVRTFDVCLEECCLKENCDTTIFEEGDAYASDKMNCFLFECRPEVDGRPGPNLCLFTFHAGYISSIQKGRGGFQDHIGSVTTVAAAPIIKSMTTANPTTHQRIPGKGIGRGACYGRVYKLSQLLGTLIRVPKQRPHAQLTKMEKKKTKHLRLRLS